MSLKAGVILAWLLLPQQPPQVDDKPEMATLDAKLGGDCSSDFTVKDAAGAPLYGALVHVRVRYGLFNVKRADLEVGTNSDGRARIEGLPTKARLLVYDVRKDGRVVMVEQDVTKTCQGRFAVELK